VNLVGVMNKNELVYEQDFDNLESNCQQHRIDKYRYILQSPADMEISV